MSKNGRSPSNNRVGFDGVRLINRCRSCTLLCGIAGSHAETLCSFYDVFRLTRLQFFIGGELHVSGIEAQLHVFLIAIDAFRAFNTDKFCIGRAFT